jgi:HPt (histidine-containing phosphotransfer) domain-containing protein
MIALTASVEAERRHLAIEAGMDSFIMKPLDVAILKAEVARLTSGRVAALGLSGSMQPVDAPAERLEAIDWAAGVIRWGGEEVLVRAIRTFVSETRAHLGSLRTEDTPDATRIKHIMHRFKGAAGNLSLLRIAATAKAAEAASVAMTAEAWGATLSDLGGELETVATLLDGRRATATGTSAPPARTVGADDLADLIEQVAATFRNFEIDEALLMELSSTAGSENFEPVQRAVDSFDFEAALKALDTLKLALKHSVTA